MNGLNALYMQPVPKRKIVPSGSNRMQMPILPSLTKSSRADLRSGSKAVPTYSNYVVMDW